MYQQFQHVEQQYYTLRGQYSVGRLTAAEFDAALHALIIQDARGRLWMIGANTGNWYFSEGGVWQEGNPFQADSVQLPPPPPHPTGSEHDEVPGQAGFSGRGLALPFLATGIILMIVAGLAFLFFSADSSGASTSDTLPTRIVPPTVIALLSTATPSRTPTKTATRIPVAGETTPIPITLTPAALELEPTNSAPVLTVIPTITPGASVGNTTDSEGPFADAVFNPTPDSVLASGLPPDVYVTDIRYSPNPAPQRQPVTFTASFLNTNAQNVGLEWRIVMLNPAKPGRNKDWGESQLMGITIPPGTSEFTLSYTPVTSSGPCILLQATVARRLDDNGRFVLPGLRGGPHYQNITFC